MMQETFKECNKFRWCREEAKFSQLHVGYLGPLLFVLIKPVSMSVHTYVWTDFDTGGLSTKRSSDFNKIWYVDRDWWEILNSVPYDPIQGQGHDVQKFAKWPIKSYLLHHCACYGESWASKTISKFS